MGNHLPRFLHHQHIPHPHILAGHLVGIVEARPADDRAGQFHRLQIGHRCHRAAAADLHADASEACRCLIFFKLPGDCPAGAFGGLAEEPLLAKRIDLNDKPIHLEVERVQFLDQIGAPLDERLNRRKALAAGSHRQARRLCPGKEPRLRLHAEASGIADAVAEKPQRPAGALPRIEQPDAAGGHVAGVGKGSQSLLRLRLVEGYQRRVGHVDLATHFDQLRRGGQGQPQRHPMNAAHVVGDVVADAAVAPGGPLSQNPFTVGESHRHAVDFQLQHPADRRRADPFGCQQFLHAAAPGLQIGGAVGVVHREHRQPVTHGVQFRHRLIPHPLRGAVGGDGLWVRLLQVAEFPQEQVVGPVGDLGLRLDVILPVVVPDLVAQLADLGGDVGVHVWSAPVVGFRGAGAVGLGCAADSRRSRCIRRPSK